MDFRIPDRLSAYLDELDEFITTVIRPLEEAHDNIRFFDHRREDARTNWEEGGVPTEDWEALLAQVRKLADEAGHFRYALPERLGGQGGSNLEMGMSFSASPCRKCSI